MKALKSSQGYFRWFGISLNLKLMPHILPTSANEAIGEEIVDYYPVFYNAFTVSSNAMKRFTAHRPEETLCL